MRIQPRRTALLTPDFNSQFVYRLHSKISASILPKKINGTNTTTTKLKPTYIHDQILTLKPKNYIYSILFSRVTTLKLHCLLSLLKSTFILQLLVVLAVLWCIVGTSGLPLPVWRNFRGATSV